MKPAPFALPTPRELADHPELAVLFLLAEALDVAARTLLAAHPVLLGDERPYWMRLSADAEAAERLLAALGRLSKGLLRYRAALCTCSNDKGCEPAQPADESPF